MKPLNYTERAWRIVDRLLPSLPPAHGFYEPDNFIAAARRRGQRQELFWRVMPKLRAKAEGGAPYIAMPKGTSVHEGTIMERVSNEFARAAMSYVPAVSL